MYNELKTKDVIYLSSRNVANSTLLLNPLSCLRSLHVASVCSSYAQVFYFLFLFFLTSRHRIFRHSFNKVPEAQGTEAGVRPRGFACYDKTSLLVPYFHDY